MKHRHLVMLMIVTLAAMGSVRAALADAGPKPPPDPWTVAPDEYTMVQMESENVLLVVGDGGVAYVQAYFKLRNQGTATETIDVQFPLGWAVNPALNEDFTVWVDGARSSHTVEVDQYGNTWAVWKMTFAPGQLVNLGVSYIGFGTTCYNYILQTGAGWYDTIGEGTITFRLPFEINDFNTRFDERYSSPHPDYYTVSGTDVTWHFTDLEPTNDDDIRLCMMGRQFWQDIQKARQAVAANPESPDVNLKLARILNQALTGFPEYSGSDERFPFIMEPISAADQNEAEEAVKSYEQSLEAASDAGNDDYVDYAALLLAMTGCAPPFHANLRPTVNHIPETDPNNERFLILPEACRRLSTDDLDAYLIATPTSIPPTSTPWPTGMVYTSPLTPTSTLATMLTPTSIPISAPPSDATSPITLWAAIGAAVIGGAGAGVWAYRKRRAAGG